MSGFSGILSFDEQTSAKLGSYFFPEKLNGYYTKWYQTNCRTFSLNGYNNGKFRNDSEVLQDEGRIIGFDGVRLINTRLEGIVDSINFIKTMNSVRGSFTSFYMDTTAQEFVLLADQTGSRQIFYYWNSCFFAFSSSIFLLIDILRHFHINISLSLPASYMLLSLGYLLDDHTLVSEIKKVTAGHYVYVNKEGVKIEKYHDYYRKVLYNKLTNDLVEELNSKFKRSIELEYEKDKEYGFEHLATLSGGLDSRLNVMLANKYGYHNVSCVTFSEGFKSDEMVARKITHDLSLKHIVVLLNGGFQLFDIETPLILNNCAVHYFGAAHTLAAVKRLNFSNYGLFHNGILAESSKGSYLSGKEHCPPSLDRHFPISEKLFDRLDGTLLEKIFEKYPTKEMFVTYSRGFNAAHNGSWMTMPFTDSVYTYMDMDYADLAYSIHPSLRFNGYLTVEWIKKLNPEAGNYVWHRGIKPTNELLRLFLAKVSYRLKLILTRKWDIAFPVNEWYTANPMLRQFVQEQFDNSDAWEVLPGETSKDVKSLFLNGSPTEKLLCISYLKSVELLFT